MRLYTLKNNDALIGDEQWTVLQSYREDYERT